MTKNHTWTIALGALLLTMGLVPGGALATHGCPGSYRGGLGAVETGYLSGPGNDNAHTFSVSLSAGDEFVAILRDDGFSTNLHLYKGFNCEGGEVAQGSTLTHQAASGDTYMLLVHGHNGGGDYAIVSAKADLPPARSYLHLVLEDEGAESQESNVQAYIRSSAKGYYDCDWNGSQYNCRGILVEGLKVCYVVWSDSDSDADYSEDSASVSSKTCVGDVDVLQQA